MRPSFLRMRDSRISLGSEARLSVQLCRFEVGTVYLILTVFQFLASGA